MKTLETVHATVEKIDLYYNLIFWNLLNTLIFCSCFLFVIFYFRSKPSCRNFNLWTSYSLCILNWQCFKRNLEEILASVRMLLFSAVSLMKNVVVLKNWKAVSYWGKKWFLICLQKWISYQCYSECSFLVLDYHFMLV